MLLHELGHAAVIRAFGHRPFVILHALGGTTAYSAQTTSPEAPSTEAGVITPVLAPARKGPHPAAKLFISLSGPVAGFVFAALSLAIARALGVVLTGDTGASVALRYVIVVNVALGVINLIPMLPLDGGHALAAALEALFPRVGTKIARVSSLAIGVILLAVSVGYGLIAPGMLLVIALIGNYRDYRFERDIAPTMRLAGRVREGFNALSQSNYALADEMATLLLQDAYASGETGEPFEVYLSAGAHLRAWAALGRGQAQAAADAMALVPEGRAVDPSLRAAVLLALGDAPNAAHLLREIYAQSSAPHVSITERLVEAHVLAGLFDQLADVLASRTHDVARDTFARALDGAFASSAFSAAARIADVAFTTTRDPEFAVDSARAWCRHGDFEKGLDAIKRARRAGFLDVEKLAADDDFAGIRSELP